MNISEIVPQTNGTLAHYFAAMIPLAVITVWLAIGMNARVESKNEHILWHMLWPFRSIATILTRVWDGGREFWFSRREGFRAPAETLRHVDSRMPRSRTRSRVRDSVPMRNSRSRSVSRGRTPSRRSSPTTAPMGDVAVRDYAHRAPKTSVDVSESPTAAATRAPSTVPEG